MSDYYPAQGSEWPYRQGEADMSDVGFIKKLKKVGKKIKKQASRDVRFVKENKSTILAAASVIPGVAPFAMAAAAGARAYDARKAAKAGAEVDWELSSMGPPGEWPAGQSAISTPSGPESAAGASYGSSPGGGGGGRSMGLGGLDPKWLMLGGAALVGLVLLKRR